jgi:hypothetical protein
VFINLVSFKDTPVYHIFPPIYENLGLAEVTSFIEQRFEFSYKLGKIERTGYGSIRLYIRDRGLRVIINEKLPGIGPVKLEKLKSLLLETVKSRFIENIEFDHEKRRVYYTDFRKGAKDRDKLVD